jgi:hypothetical protein
VASCDVLIVLIGRQWLTSTDTTGQRRLDNPQDFVRQEIATALRRNIRVIPALIQDTPISRATDLPEDLKTLSRRNALEISDTHFHRDVDQLIGVLDRVLGVQPSSSSQSEASTAARAQTGPYGGTPRESATAVPRAQSSQLRSWRFWVLVCIICIITASLSALVYTATRPNEMSVEAERSIIARRFLDLEVKRDTEGIKRELPRPAPFLRRASSGRGL